MNCFRLVMTGLLLLLSLAANAARAAGEVEITRVEGHYLDRVINMVIEWQSANPVVKAKITVGRETREMLIDEYENRRDPRGYHGSLSLQLPAEPLPSIPYTIQLEDDLRQQSAMVNGKVTPSTTAGATPYQTYSQPYGQTYGQTYGQGYGQTYGQSDDNWGRKASGTTYRPEPGTPAGSAGGMVDRLIQVVDRYDLAPSIDKIRVNILSPDNVSFATKANDDKGLQEIRFKVYDRKGLLVGTQSLHNLGKVWEGSSQTFAIGGGLFRVTAQAVDSASNTSKEQSATFELTGKTVELAPLPDNSLPQASQQQGYPSQSVGTDTTQPSSAYPTTQQTYDPYGQAAPASQQPVGTYTTGGTYQSNPYQTPSGTYQDPYQQQPGTYQQSNPYQQQPAGTYQQSNPYQQQPAGTYQQSNPYQQQPTGTYQQPANPYQQPTTPTQPQTSPSTKPSWW